MESTDVLLTRIANLEEQVKTQREENERQKIENEQQKIENELLNNCTV
jgi:DNA-binding protein H-NS